MKTREISVGDIVRLRKKIKNDGTFPGVPWGEVIVDKGEVGVVMDIGYFLMTNKIYTVHFPRLGILVGCLGSELEVINESQETSTI